ncbi:MAG: stage IV sporulation protein A [Oscillospiraceae bacterium]|nr:stage IV sporulation protein A [Oscillospiraceae bacterium]
MTGAEIYRDIAVRTGGSLLFGVVGPVRTGKSTFIKRFMNALVLPNIRDDAVRSRALDELPQSGGGRTVMTAEPKFVPEEAVRVSLGRSEAEVRLIDCVGYMVPSALGQFEDDMPRMVSTPWSEDPIPMSEAAEIGTKKVITDHSTVGILVTADGSFTEIPRAEYAEAEERVLAELDAAGKPYVAVVNSVDPEGETAQRIAGEIRARHGAAAVCANVAELTEPELVEILGAVLGEFPLAAVDLYLPEWCDALDSGHRIKAEVFSAVAARAGELKKVSDAPRVFAALSGPEHEVRVTGTDLATGRVSVDYDIPKSVFWSILAEESGFALSGEAELLPLMRRLGDVSRRWERVAAAVETAEQTGYGVVAPAEADLKLEEPAIIRQGSRFGVRLCASAPSLHILRADVSTTVSPIVGSESQSEELAASLAGELERDSARVWHSNIFGKTLSELVNEGVAAKLAHLQGDAREKIREMLERVINEGSNGLICILL